jgi:hypothetical protein
MSCGAFGARFSAVLGSFGSFWQLLAALVGATVFLWTLSWDNRKNPFAFVAVKLRLPCGKVEKARESSVTGDGGPGQPA